MTIKSQGTIKQIYRQDNHQTPELNNAAQEDREIQTSQALLEIHKLKLNSYIEKAHYLILRVLIQKILHYQFKIKDS